MKRVFFGLSVTCLTLTFLSAFGWLVHASFQDSDKLPAWLKSSVTALAGFPDQLFLAKEQVVELPKTFVPTPEDFEPINKLEDDLKILTSYSLGPLERKIVLVNLKDGKELKSWTRKVWSSQSRICHSLLLPDSSVIFNREWASGLIRLSSEGAKLWEQTELKSHHGANLGSDSTVWTCVYRPDTTLDQNISHRVVFEVGDRQYSSIDNSVAQLSLADGSILFEKSIVDMLLENGLKALLLQSDIPKDLIHLNDVQPVLEDGPHALKGDLFLSLRNLSTILHYRPSTNEVLRVIRGPFQAQHDIDIESDSTLILFNNNTFRRGIKSNLHLLQTDTMQISRFNSEIVRYNLATGAFSLLENEVMYENNIFTNTEGLVERLDPKTLFIEEQNTGILWVVKEGEVLYKNVLPSQHEGYHHLANWSRVIP